MAEQKKPRKPAPSSKSSTRNPPSRVTVTNRSAEGKPSAQKSGKGKRRPAPAEGTPRKKERRSAERRSNFVRNYLPYILGFISLFLAVCFVVDAFGKDVDPADHPMGYFGYYICYALFGLLSWVAYLIPAVLAVLTVFWQRYFNTGKVISKVVLSSVLMLLLASLTHVIACTADESLADVLDPVELFEGGTAYTTGGIFGGYVGCLLYWALRLPGTIVLSVAAIPLIIMCLVGVTPAEVFGKLWRLIREAQSRRADRPAKPKKVTYQDDEDEEDGEDEYEKPVFSPRARRDTRDDRQVIRLDPETGEILEDEDGEDVPARKEHNRKSKHKVRGERDEDAPATLPLFDPEPRVTPPEADDLPWQDAEPVTPRPVTAATAATADPLPFEEEDDGEDAMQVGFDDEPDDMIDDEAEETFVPTRISGRRVSYEVVTGEETVGTRPAGEPVSVRILKSETSAVDERGLSEEEIVLPSASHESPAPVEEAREYQFPSPDMLTRGPSKYEANDAEIAENTQILRDVLESFRIGVREISCSCGPTITRFEVKPDTGVRVRSIANLVDDIAMGLAKAGVRIEAPIPGKSAVGIEVPNAEPAMVYLRNILETPEFRNHKSRLAACLGADVSGRPVIMDINKMPHLLIAGATGTGKSVCINSLIMSILYHARPDEVKLILIDPKKVEFAVYRDLPHLYAPVVSDPKKAAGALNSAVNEMERRFELIEEVGVRNLAGYNEITAGDPERPPLPQMVIIIDELADLMMTAPAEVETAICRLAQKARAAGIHLVIGTQRPSVDVITGLIKANVPSRIAFTVKAAVDSRTILDSVGADKLIGRGDMLYAPIGCSKPMRVQGAFVSESEVEQVVTYIKEHNDKPVYNEDFTRSIDVEAAKCGKKKGEQMSLDDFDGLGGGRNDSEDPKFWEALEVAVTKDKIGTSALQRACNLGYGRAAKIIDRMEELGFVGPDPGTKQGRKVLISKEEYLRYKVNGLPGSGTDEGDGEDF